jgi:hypothetical protein
MSKYKKDKTRISPSTILNYYFPMDNTIPQDILERAGIRGNILHSAIENSLLKESFTFGELAEKIDSNNQISENDKKTLMTQFANFSSFNENLELEENRTLEEFVELEKIRGYIDYRDSTQIIDWKTNSVLGKKELEKYELQLNIYRYMIFKKHGKKIDKLKIVHLTKKEKLTPTGKERKAGDLLKVYDCKIYSIDYIDSLIDVVYTHLILNANNEK